MQAWHHAVSCLHQCNLWYGVHNPAQHVSSDGQWGTSRCSFQHSRAHFSLVLSVVSCKNTLRSASHVSSSGVRQRYNVQAFLLLVKPKGPLLNVHQADTSDELECQAICCPHLTKFRTYALNRAGRPRCTVCDHQHEHFTCKANQSPLASYQPNDLKPHIRELLHLQTASASNLMLKPI